MLLIFVLKEWTEQENFFNNIIISKSEVFVQNMYKFRISYPPICNPIKTVKISNFFD